MDDPDKLRKIIRGCFDRLYDDFTELDQTKDPSTVIDRDVDFSTLADKRLSCSLREYFASQPDTYIVRSEESTVDEPDSADWIVIGDEIDGTANMINGGDIPFGPIIAITTEREPRFNDVAAMGFMSLRSGDLYEAYRGEGAFLTKGWANGDDETGESSRRLSTSSRTAFSEDEYPQILVDQYMLSGRPALAEVCWTVGYPGDFRSWAYHIALVARGTYDLAVTGDYCTFHQAKRSTAEELAGGYLLLSEAGGTITTWTGDDIGPEPIGMNDGRTFDTIAAATEQLAVRFSDRLP